MAKNGARGWANPIPNLNRWLMRLINGPKRNGRSAGLEPETFWGTRQKANKGLSILLGASSSAPSLQSMNKVILGVFQFSMARARKRYVYSNWIGSRINKFETTAGVHLQLFHFFGCITGSLFSMQEMGTRREKSWAKKKV